MRIANIIVFHKDPSTVERLLNALAHPDFDFYLHLDKKVDISPFAYLSELPNTCFVEKRACVTWGGYSQVQAVINAFHAILHSGKSYDFVNLLSGQDYPIKPANEIRDTLLPYTGKSLMITETPPSAWWDEANWRFEKYHFVDYWFKGRYRFGEILSKLLPARNLPSSLKLYGGPYASYWILSIEAVEYLYAVLSKKYKHKRFFKHTWAPDEFLIHTLLMNSPLRSTVMNENYHHIDRSQGGGRPKTLTMDDFPALCTSDKLFARKFDPLKDAAILDRIDKELLRTENRQVLRHKMVQ